MISITLEWHFISFYFMYLILIILIYCEFCYCIILYIAGLLVDDIVVSSEREEWRRTGRSIIAIHKSCVDAESTVAVPSIIATNALVEVRLLEVIFVLFAVDVARIEVSFV